MLKNIYILLTIFALFTLNSCGNDDWEIAGKVYKFEQVKDNVYVLEGPLNEANEINGGLINNIVLIVGKDGLILVDIGSGYNIGKKVLKEVEKISKLPIKAVFYSHLHGDHFLGTGAIVEKYPNAKIYASKTMDERLKDGEGDSWVVFMESATKGATQGTKIIYPTDIVKHLQKLTIAGEELIIYDYFDKTHSDSLYMIYHPKTEVLFTSDNSFENRFGMFDVNSDMHNNIKLLKDIKSIATTFIPGHGKTGDYNLAVKPFLDYLEIMQQEALKAYDEGLQAYEAKEQIVKKLQPIYGTWSRFDEMVGPHIIKMMAEIEERDF